MSRVRSFFRLGPADRILVMEAAMLLGIARVLVHAVRFERIAGRLGRHMSETPEAATAEDHACARRVRWAVERAARHLPFEAVCLPQAIAAKLMLQRRGVPTTLYLGVARDPDLKAHAWLRAGRVIVTGREGRSGFSVISTFA